MAQAKFTEKHSGFHWIKTNRPIKMIAGALVLVIIIFVNAIGSWVAFQHKEPLFGLVLGLVLIGTALLTWRYIHTMMEFTCYMQQTLNGPIPAKSSWKDMLYRAFARCQETRVYAMLVLGIIGAVPLFFALTQVQLTLLLIEDDQFWLGFSTGLVTIMSALIFVGYCGALWVSCAFFQYFVGEDDEDTRPTNPHLRT